jgi:hypothetical protein
VGALAREAKVGRIKRQRMQAGVNCYRSVVVLYAKRKLVDQFFNSASGYRAQYFVRPSLGIEANQSAVRALLASVLRALERDGRWAERVFVEISLLHPQAKVWIHQGLWLRRARRQDHVLLVRSWQAQLTAEEPRRRKLARWGALAPADETRLCLKGGFLRDGQIVNSAKTPSARAQELHEVGFT